MPVSYQHTSGIYEGSLPYVFISYAHKDNKARAQVTALLDQNHIRYWYDDGLHSGDDWNRTISGRLKNCAVCLLLLSPDSAASTYVKDELNFAKTHKIPIHTLMLQDFTLPDDIEMMTGRFQRIPMRGNYGAELVCALPRSVFAAAAPEPVRRAPAPQPAKPVRTRSARRTGGAGLKAVIVLLVLCAVVALGVFVAWPSFIYPNFIYPNQPCEELYTPELLQSYSGSYRTDRVSGQAIVTFTDCDEAGKVQGYLEFITDDAYGKYEISGTVDSKLNNGNMTLTVNPGKWIVRPDGYESLGAMQISVTQQYQAFSCGTYRMNWSSGDLDDEHSIKTAQDLSKLSGADGVFYLRGDIDLSGMNWTPIEGFTGTLLGNGFAIQNMTIEADTSDVGFFSVLEGTVINLCFEDASVTVTGRNEDVGILCGELKGHISGIRTSGTVTAEKSAGVGGVAGYVSIVGSYCLDGMENLASVTGLTQTGGCFGTIYDEIENGIDPYTVVLSNNRNSGTVTAAEDFSGGIVSYISGTATGIGGSVSVTVQDCENTGTVTGQYHVGGIVGYADSDKDSYIDGCTNASEIHASAYAGCIAGETGKFFITNCGNEGSALYATGYYLEEGRKFAYVGGLVGRGTCLENCTNYIDINYNGGGDFVGGLMGYCNLDQAVTGESLTSDTAQANFKNLTNLGTVAGNSYVGGITGGTAYFWNNGCTHVSAVFERLTNSGVVMAEGDFAGGLAGYMAGDVGGIGGSLDWFIYDCVNECNVSGYRNVGGLFGGFRNGAVDGSTYASNTVTIDGCLVSGEIIGGENCGEHIGLDEIKRE